MSDLHNNIISSSTTTTDKYYTFNSKVAFLLIAVGSAALVITIYHCLTSTWRNRHNLRRRRGSSPNPQEDAAELGAEEVGMSSYDESSTAQLFPAHKYQKGMEMGWAEEDATCAICLSEFVEGEETKTLPICLHSYHAECIDMWLFSHSNCPMCRTDATPSPSPRVELGLGGGGSRSSSGSGTSTYSRSDHMLEMY